MKDDTLKFITDKMIKEVAQSDPRFVSAPVRVLVNEIPKLMARIVALREGIELSGIIGSCSCDIKTPDLGHHEDYCRYRQFSLLLAADDKAQGNSDKDN
jgi:hypothetical protein